MQPFDLFCQHLTDASLEKINLSYQNMKST